MTIVPGQVSLSENDSEPEVDEHHAKLDPDEFKRMIDKLTTDFPHLALVATTLRRARTATLNDWGAICCYDGHFYEAQLRQTLEIYDRVGGGTPLHPGSFMDSSRERIRNGPSIAAPPMAPSQ
jgi:hypothetical protein